ncbi:Uncharacterised protein [uncultured archaeon]|nr:Uncharacterised protein [uncultured archaeon]
MDEQKLKELETALYKEGSCAVIEVTNGICNRRIDDKIKEAKDDKKFIEAVTFEEFPVTTGIFFFRQGAMSDTNYKDIDYACQIPEYIKDMAKEALARTVLRAQNSDQKKLAYHLIWHMENGDKLEDLLYAEKRHPSQLEDAEKKYANTLAAVKGTFLEEYAGLLTARAIKQAKIYVAFKYGKLRKRLGLPPRKPIHYKGSGDIDLIIAAPEKEIVTGLTNQKYFDCKKTE